MLVLMLVLMLVAGVAGLRWVVVVLLVLVLVLVLMVAVRLRRGSCRGRGRRGAFGGVVDAVKVPEKVAASRIGALAVARRRRRQWWRLLRRRRLLRRSQGRMDIPSLVAAIAVGVVIGRCWLCLCL